MKIFRNATTTIKKVAGTGAASVLAAGVALATTAVFAQSGQAAPATASTQADTAASSNAKFQRLDVNHDGFLSRSELKQFRDYAKAFDEADVNHDGKLSSDDFIKAESIYQRQQAAQYMDDSVLTLRVKAALLKEVRLDSTQVSVETFHGQVLLSGFVDDSEQIRKALKVATSIDGVLGVRNGLVVK